MNKKFNIPTIIPHKALSANPIFARLDPFIFNWPPGLAHQLIGHYPEEVKNICKRIMPGDRGVICLKMVITISSWKYSFYFIEE